MNLALVFTYISHPFLHSFITERKVMHQKLVGVTIDEELTFRNMSISFVRTEPKNWHFE